MITSNKNYFISCLFFLFFFIGWGLSLIHIWKRRKPKSLPLSSALSRSNSVSGRVIPCLISARIAAITPWRVSREKRSLFHS